MALLDLLNNQGSLLNPKFCHRQLGNVGVEPSPTGCGLILES